MTENHELNCMTKKTMNQIVWQKTMYQIAWQKTMNQIAHDKKPLTRRAKILY